MRAANDDRVVETAPVDSQSALRDDEEVRDEDGGAESAVAGDEPSFDVADADALAIQAEANESPAPAPEPDGAEAAAAAEPALEAPAIETAPAPRVSTTLTKRLA